MGDAAPVRIEVVARLAEDGRHVDGTLAVDAPGCVLADALSALPDPPSDLQSLRTFPGAVDHGHVSVEDRGDGRVRFATRLPERFGVFGATGLGTYANGGWAPVVLCGGRVPVARWRVTVTLPAGVTGLVGATVGEGTVSWEGLADRVPLVAVSRPPVALASGVTLLSGRRPSRRFRREVSALLPEDAAGVVVRAPLRRRLTADAPGVAFVSDRAFRLAPGLEPAHRRGVARGLAAGLSGLPDDFERDFVGAAASRGAPGVERLLGVFRWVPQVNWLLTSQRIPFWAETTGQLWPADPVVEDLSELWGPHWPGAAAVEAVADRYGDGVVVEVARALRAGAPPPVPLDPWRGPVPVEDLRLAVDGAQVVLTRDAPPTSPTDVVLRVDGVDQVVALAPGETGLFLPSPPRRVALDPLRHVPQTSSAGDAWPARWDVTFAGWVDGINLTQRKVWVGGQSTLRRWWNTHDLYLGSVYNSPSDLVGVRLGWLRKEGPLLDGISRPLRFKFDVGSALLDPSFSPTNGLRPTLDASTSVAWDDRVALDFPLRGKRVGVGVGGGLVPGTPETWVSASANAVAVASPHPRVAFAGRGAAAVAASTEVHRLLVLGGDAGIRSVPALPACPAPGEACLPVASQRLTGAFEIRTAPVRNASVPAIVAWGSELQLAVGFEGLLARTGDGPVSATGVTVSAVGLAEVLGVETSALGLTAAFRTSSAGLPLPASGPPELYLRFGQSF